MHLRSLSKIQNTIKKTRDFYYKRITIQFIFQVDEISKDRMFDQVLQLY